MAEWTVLDYLKALVESGAYARDCTLSDVAYGEPLPPDLLTRRGAVEAGLVNWPYEHPFDYRQGGPRG